MSAMSDRNQFRRLTGDYGKNDIPDTEIEDYFDDAARQATSTEGTMVTVTDFDLLDERYKPEIVILAAINWWWNRAADYTDSYSTTIGQSSEQAGVRWDRAIQMIQQLQTMYENVAVLGNDPTMANLSRYSKITLSRIGGVAEEDTEAKYEGA